MRTFVLIASLLCVPSAAFAGGIYYLAADGGNDGNSCLNAARPCKTPQGVLKKMPKTLVGAYTINGAAGDYYAQPSDSTLYSGMFDFSGFVRGTGGASITVMGTMTALTGNLLVAGGSGGSSSGTDVLAIDAPSGATLDNMVDAGFAYSDGGMVANSMNDLMLFYVSGTGSLSSGRFAPIVSNDNASITTANALGSAIPDQTSVVQVVKPGMVLHNATAAAPSTNFWNNTVYSSTTVPIQFNRVDFAAANTSFGTAVTATHDAAVTVFNSRVLTGGGLNGSFSASTNMFNSVCDLVSHQICVIATNNSSTSISAVLARSAYAFALVGTQSNGTMTQDVYVDPTAVWAHDREFAQVTGASTLSVNSSTFSSGSPSNPGGGGAFAVSHGGVVTLTNMTMFNSGGHFMKCTSGGTYEYDDATVNAYSSADTSTPTTAFASTNQNWSTGVGQQNGYFDFSKIQMDALNNPDGGGTDWSWMDPHNGCVFRQSTTL